MFGAGGDDNIDAGSGDDLIYGGPGNDSIRAGDGDDRIRAGRDDDQVSGGDGDDKIAGGSGNDSLSGGNGDDIVFSGIGDDVVSGDDGDDRLFGGQGEDDLSGGDGDDGLIGGFGDDLLTGGAGADVFAFAYRSGTNADANAETNESAERQGSGDDTITDFSAEDGDTIRLFGDNLDASFETGDSDGDGIDDFTLITISQSTGDDASEAIVVGTITVEDALLTEDDVSITPASEGFESLFDMAG